MESIDDRLRRELRRQAGSEGLEGAEPTEPHILEEVLETFRGRQRWLVIFAVGYSVVFVGLAIWSLVEFLGAQTVPMQLRWGALLFASMMVIIAVKVWFWLEMHKNRVVREVKRLELQVARLAGRLG